MPVVQEHFAAGGRRVRARICFDAGVRLGLDAEEALRAATVCELLHNASLIQDDLLDRTAMRRARASVWARYGDTVAVCAGDLMLSAAYGVLADLSAAGSLAAALRLVHRRTSEVIVGQAAECLCQKGQQDTVVFYEQQAKGKSASLLSLAVELPLLLAGYPESMPAAHASATQFAIAYQIADDLEDCDQDAREGSPNLLLLLQSQEGLTLVQARRQAISLAGERLASAEAQARVLPRACATSLLEYAEALRRGLEVRAGSSLETVRAGD
jgi:geranylgeranyl diphosphate synthase type II